MSLRDGALSDPTHQPSDITSHPPHSGAGNARERQYGRHAGDLTLMWGMPLNRSGWAPAQGEGAAIVCRRGHAADGSTVLCSSIKEVNGSLKVKNQFRHAEMLLESPDRYIAS